ncbi:MAG: methyltransferase domain-containing protein, partial [Pseudonocardiaceae bacterium]
MDVVDTGSWKTRASGLAATLVASGVLLDPAWQDAFASIPRHVFVPQVLDGDVVRGTGDPGWTSRPTVMAVMLERLAAEPGHRVLEIGTGTGYHTALLAHRLGDHAVYSVDLDPVLVDSARDHLAEIGRHPQLAAGDGAQGWPDGRSFDRIIATCAVTAIPLAWI